MTCLEERLETLLCRLLLQSPLLFWGEVAGLLCSLDLLEDVFELHRSSQRRHAVPNTVSSGAFDGRHTPSTYVSLNT